MVYLRVMKICYSEKFVMKLLSLLNKVMLIKFHMPDLRNKLNRLMDLLIKDRLWA